MIPLDPMQFTHEASIAARAMDLDLMGVHSPAVDSAEAAAREDGMIERKRVLALLRRHGWNSTSFQVLEPGFRYWFDRDDACVGYVDTGRTWVVAGPPIAPADRLAEVAARFADAASAADRRTAWFGTERRFSSATTWPALRIGDQPVWSPAAWAGVVERSKNLREQLRRARAKGVTVRALALAELAADHPTRAQVETLIVRWLASRPAVLLWNARASRMVA
jgi:phosphatidylglycerol lysyltransferase